MKQTKKRTGKKSGKAHTGINRRLKSMMAKLDAEDLNSKVVPNTHVWAETPSSDAIERFCSIPLIENRADSAKAGTGRVVYDSWRALPTQAMRNVAEGHIRRVTIKAGRLRLELVAERRAQKWEFIARVYSDKKVRHDCLIITAGRKLLPGSGGFYHWTSTRTPRTIELQTYSQHHLIEGIAW